MLLLGVLIVLCSAALALDNRFFLERFSMSVQDQINAIVAQLHKAKDEIVGKLEEATAGIQAQLVDAGVAEEVDLSALAGIAQALDDLVPDAAVDEAVDEASEEDEASVEDETSDVVEAEVVEEDETSADEDETSADEEA
jgi:hypothetical protein